MVVPTQEKPLFGVNYASNTSPLFFEFDFEPTSVSFKPQATLSTPAIKAKRKKVLYSASKLALGLLVTAFVIGSGILNNELLMGKSADQASLGWIPTWMEDVPTEPKATVVAAVLETTESKEEAADPESVFIVSNKENDFSSTIATGPNTEENPWLSAPVTESERVEDEAPTTLKTSTEVTETPVKPIIKPSVGQSEVKLSSPEVYQKRKMSNKLAVTSDAFHAISAKTAIDGKKVFIKFGAKWCLPCKMMESNVFPDQKIRELLAENYHTLTVDVDNLDGINLRQIYNIETLPSFLILDSNQNVIEKHEGAKRIEELRNILGTAKP